MIRKLNLVSQDIQGLTNLMNQWDDIPNEITYDSIYDKVAKIKNSNCKSEIIVAEQDSKIVGYAFLTEVVFLGQDSFIEVQSILVDKNVRRSGIGKMLMQYAEQWAVDNGFKKIMLSSRVQLENAHSFYKGLGYTVAKQSYFFSKAL